jgi:hypothetical protein
MGLDRGCPKRPVGQISASADGLVARAGLFLGRERFRRWLEVVPPRTF